MHFRREKRLQSWIGRSQGVRSTDPLSKASGSGKLTSPRPRPRPRPLPIFAFHHLPALVSVLYGGGIVAGVVDGCVVGGGGVDFEDIVEDAQQLEVVLL